MVTFDFVKTPITQIADFIIVQSAKSNASDIHFDPRENGLIVRMRIDGELKDYTFIPKIYERNLVTRLKLLASMNITESRLPQDGAIKGNIGGMNLDMRVSSLPTNEGEKVVIRILDYSRSLSGMKALGFHEKNFEKLNRMIHVPNGIILVTGATGSGKSTTVYSVLQELNKEETNIITVEDPIEMNIEGMNQVQVNSEIGLDFATVLRSILRQDPNIILIGEIRDSETAQIAVRASITGHLVLSTIHTNNSLSTIERLLDMNVERYLLSSALTGIISQRLAKKLCPHCRVEKEATPYEKKVFKVALEKDVDKLFAANPNGCKECSHGYKGRVAIHEVLEIDDQIRDALTENIEKDDLREIVYTPKVIAMLQDALIKVLSGDTSFDEVYKVIDVDDDLESIFKHNLERYEENQEEEIISPKDEEKDEEVEAEKEEENELIELNPDENNEVIDLPSVEDENTNEAETNEENQEKKEEENKEEDPKVISISGVGNIQIETEEIKIVPPDEDENNIEDLFDGDQTDDDTIEILDETPEKEDYYNKLGVKPRILPSVKLNSFKINKNLPGNNKKPVTVQLSGNNTVNMTNPESISIPQINDDKGTE